MFSLYNELVKKDNNYSYQYLSYPKKILKRRTSVLNYFQQNVFNTLTTIFRSQFNPLQQNKTVRLLEYRVISHSSDYHILYY